MVLMLMLGSSPPLGTGRRNDAVSVHTWSSLRREGGKRDARKYRFPFSSSKREGRTVSRREKEERKKGEGRKNTNAAPHSIDWIWSVSFVFLLHDFQNSFCFRAAAQELSMRSPSTGRARRMGKSFRTTQTTSRFHLSTLPSNLSSLNVTSFSSSSSSSFSSQNSATHTKKRREKRQEDDHGMPNIRKG